MNLLDKHSKKGLVILPALFLLFACEEPSELGIGLNPKEDQISTHYLEIPVETSQIKIDTIVSSSSVVSINPQAGVPTFGPVLIGKTENPAFGTLTATAFTNIGTPTTVPTVDANAAVDSAFLFLNYGTSYIGQDTSSSQTLKIYRLEEAIQPTSGTVSTKAQYKYFISDSEPVDEQNQIGEINFTLAGIKNRTLKLRLDGENALGNEFVNELLNKLKSDPSVFKNQQDFNEFIGGLAIVPGENNTFINSYNLMSGSGIALYYADRDTAISFPFRPELGENQTLAVGDLQPTYFNLDADYSNTVFENAPVGKNVEFQNPDNQLFFRAGVGLFPKFSFPELEDLVNSNLNSNIVINKALLQIDSVYNNISTQAPPEQAFFYFVEDENNRRFAGVTEINGGGFIPFAGAQLARYKTNNQDSVYRYRADVTEEVEKFVQTRDPRLLQGIVYPATSPISLLSFILEPEKVNLKIFYTVLKEENNN